MGTWTFIAVYPDDHADDLGWYDGPPYAVIESVFDEYALDARQPVGRRKERQSAIGIGSREIFSIFCQQERNRVKGSRIRTKQ